MSKIYIIAATQFEIIPCLEYLEKNFNKKSFFEYEKDGKSIFPIVSGVGSVMTTMAMCRTPKISDADMVINAGVAGTFDPKIPVGSVVEVLEDRFADLGVEEADASFTDVFEMDLLDANKFPFQNGWLTNKPATDLMSARSITVNKVHGSHTSIEQICKKYSPQVESMEGAAFLYAAKIMDLQSTQIRAISNKVEPRNRNNWELNKAIDQLNQAIIQYIEAFAK